MTQAERVEWAKDAVLTAARSLVARPHDAALRLALASRVREFDEADYALRRQHDHQQKGGEAHAKKLKRHRAMIATEQTRRQA